MPRICILDFQFGVDRLIMKPLQSIDPRQRE
jgi:hypothetical protein